MSQKTKKKLKKKLKFYPENSQIGYGSGPHHYKYSHEWIKDESQDLKWMNRIIKMGNSGRG